ncbi:Rhodanese-like protein, partial [Auricularia subglabra TFB-10046 SS5]
IVLCASSQALIEKAAALAQAKFLGRVARASLGECIWFGILENPPFVPAADSAATSDLDEEALWHILRRVAQDDAALDPLVPPPGSKSIDDILASARARLTRIKPRDAFDECVIFNNPQGAVLVDIRPAAQRHHYGEIPGALIIERNVLEWRFDPRSDARLDIATRYDLRVIVFCQEGYTSSLAAASLLDLGLKNATDIVGGFKEWKDAGLPTTGG